MAENAKLIVQLVGSGDAETPADGTPAIPPNATRTDVPTGATFTPPASETATTATATTSRRRPRHEDEDNEDEEGEGGARRPRAVDYFADQASKVREKQADDELRVRERIATIRGDRGGAASARAELEARTAERAGGEGVLKAAEIRAGASAAAGAAGIALAAKQAAEQSIKAVGQGIRDVVMATRDGSIAVAQNRPMAAVTTASNLAAKGLEKLGPAGVAAAEGLKTVTTAANAIAAVTDAFVERARELSTYDPRIAQATAQADVRRLQADIREAQRMGDRLSDLVDAQADLEITMRELLLPIKEVIVDTLTAFLDFVKNSILTVLELMKELPGINKKWADELIKGLKGEDVADVGNLLTNLLNSANNLQIGSAGSPAVASTGTPLGVPALS